MKIFYPLLLALLFLSCQTDKTCSLTGTIISGSPVTIQHLALRGCDTLIALQANTAGRFSVSFNAREIPVLNLCGRVVESNGVKWQLSTPVYLGPGEKTELTLNFKDYQVSIDAKDRNNQALQTCRKYYTKAGQDIWNRTPKPDKLKEAAMQQLRKAEEVISAQKPVGIVKEYLNTWSQLEYLNTVNAAKMNYSYMGARVPEDILEGLPEIPDMLDKPYWMIFDNASFRITDYLKANAGTSEEQLALLKSRFRTPSILTEQNRQIVSHFLFNDPYSEENMKRLEKLCADLPEKDATLEMYHKKRFSVKGAEVPDLEFQDKSGKKHRLTEFRGRYLYIDLWASWCGPCNAEIPHLKQLEKELKNKEVVFVSISVDKDRKAWEKKLEEMDMHGNQWIAGDNTIGDMLNIPGIPYFIIYDKEGKLWEYKAPRPSHPSTRQMLENLK